jgi:hypothetical protein
MNDRDLARVIGALADAYLEMDDHRRRRLLAELMRVINAAMTAPDPDEDTNRPFFSETVRSPCCEQPITIELSCHP